MFAHRGKIYSLTTIILYSYKFTYFVIVLLYSPQVMTNLANVIFYIYKRETMQHYMHYFVLWEKYPTYHTYMITILSTLEPIAVDVTISREG